MRPRDAQRAEDARQSAETKAETWAALDRRILGQWRMGEREVAPIARAVGCSREYVSKVLQREGYEVQGKQRKGAKLSAIIRKTKGEGR